MVQSSQNFIFQLKNKNFFSSRIKILLAQEQEFFSIQEQELFFDSGTRIIFSIQEQELFCNSRTRIFFQLKNKNLL